VQFIITTDRRPDCRILRR